VKLYTQTSDIDPIVYGSENCYKVYSALGSLLGSKESPVRSYSLEELKKLFDFRSKDTAVRFEDFVRTESRKVLQGKFMGRDYFIRFVKDWNEIEEKYGAILYKPVGYAKIRATVVDDSEAIFTPCHYKIDNVKILEGTNIETIEEIVSFRGRFCEQARRGEAVIAQGKVEKLQKAGEREHYRLLLGNKVSDHMILA
jgi:predicted nucleotidyltransferase